MELLKLPAPRTIQNHLQQYECRPGLNNELFELLKLRMETFEDLDRNVSLSFDEMSCHRGMSYSPHLDQIFSADCTKAQVVEVRGLRRGFRSQIYFDFNQNMTLGKLYMICLDNLCRESIFRL